MTCALGRATSLAPTRFARVGIVALGFASACGWAPEQVDAPPMLRDGPRLAFATRGDACSTLCTLAVLRCRNQNRAYGSLSECLAACEALRDDGTPGDTSGNSVACRVTYVSLANTGQAMQFCRNVAADGGLQCR